MARRGRFVVAPVLAAAWASACNSGSVTDATQPLAITCSANPTSGMVPLTVAFALNVQNARGNVSVAISYGDGTQQGADPNERHVYAVAGDYVASITVKAGVDTARCSVPITVAAAPTPTPTPSSTVPNPPGNQAPIAFFSTTPAGTTLTGKAPFTVEFNMCRTVDPDGDRLLFKMDLDGNGSFEYFGSTGADCRHEAVYKVAGTITATMCVTDVDCPSWPICWDYAPLHPYQCRSYTVNAIP
jgi:hypothetical protein